MDCRNSILAAIQALVLIVVVANAAFSQTETTTNITITLPPVNITTMPVWIVNAGMDKDILYVHTLCISLSYCPTLSLNISVCNDTSIATLVTYNITSNETINVNITDIALNHSINTSYIKYVCVSYEYNNVKGEYRFVYTINQLPSQALDILTMIVALAAVSIIARSNPRIAMIGAFAFAIILYAMAATGIVSYKIIAISYIMIIVGVLLAIMGV